MQKFFESILNHRKPLLAIIFIATLWSISLLPKLPVDAVPDITNTQVVVISRTGSLSPDQIEKRVTYPIEQEMSGLQNVKEVRSLTKFGLSLVTVIFDDATPLYFARQLVGEKLTSALNALPADIDTSLAPVTTGLGEILMWTLSLKPESPKSESDPKLQLQYLRQIQERIIRPALKQVDGIAEIDTNGGFQKEVHINYFPERLTKFGINVVELSEAVESAGESYSGGFIQQGSDQVIIRSVFELKDLDVLKNMVVKLLPNGKPVRLEDVAEVRFDHTPRIGAASRAGEETVLGIALMRVGANSRTVAINAEEKLRTLELPSDVQAEVVYNRAELVGATIRTIEKNLLEGALLVVAVLFALLGRMIAALIVASAIPISMLFATSGMLKLGLSANLMSLGAIDFGLLVDASVVMIENILRRFHLEKTHLTMPDRVRIISQACAEVAPPVVFGMAIIMLVYVPILSLEGVEGKMFEPMAITVLLALAASLIFALVLIPVLSLYGIHKKPTTQHSEPILARAIQRIYLPALTFALKRPQIPLLFAFALLVAGTILFSRLGSEFVPQLDEGDLVIGVIRDPKQHIEASIAAQLEVEKVISGFPEVKVVFSRVGTPESGTDPMSPNFADTFVILKKGEEVPPNARDKNQLFTEIRDKLLAMDPNQDISQNQPIEMRFNEILEGSRADVTLKVIGPELDVLLDLAEKGKNLLEPIRGVESIEFDALTGLTQTHLLDLKIDSNSAQKYRVPISSLNRQFETALAGVQLGSYVDEGFRIPIRLHLDESLRDDRGALGRIPIAIDRGSSIPLEKLVRFDERKEVTTIARHFSQRYSAVSINLSGRDVESFVREAQAAVQSELALPPGYQLHWGGQFKNLERAKARLAWIIPLTLLAVFLLLTQSTGNLLQALIIFAAVPVGLAGGVFSLSIRQMNFSVSAAIGFIALSGIVILNSMVLVSFINQLHGFFGRSPSDAVKEGALERLLPVSITALVASLGFIPMALNTGLGAEVQRPLATVVIGGLMTSTLLTLLVVPVLMRWALGRSRP